MSSTPEELCFRATPRSHWRFDPAGSITALPHLTGGGVLLEMSTFFGAFSLTTWCGNAGIDEVTVQVRFKGTCSMKIFEDDGYRGRNLLWEQRVSSDGSDPVSVNLTSLTGMQGILFPLFEVYQGDELELFSIDYLTNVEPRHEPRLAIVMPTYKRESYALKNIKLISEEVLGTSGGNCHLFVVDNAGTLDCPELEGVSLHQNRNFGGSGGFARGVLEVSRSETQFTNILFCDDDVSIATQSINRLLSLLRYLDSNSVVTGGMLKMSSKRILHEKNANVKGMRFSSNRGNNDMDSVESVARYDEVGFSTFCGWWFACYPLGANNALPLPYPFFVGWDDVEMGRRCNRAGLKSLSMLGIAVWHEEFEKKDVAWRWFYHTRNGIVTNMLYDKSRRSLKQSIVEIMTALLTYRYDRAEFMIDGLAAVSDPVRSIKENPADELHSRLMARPQAKLQDARHMVIPGRLWHQPAAGRWTKLATRLTMNGHLIPRVFFKTADEPVDAGWGVEELHSNRLVTIFRCPQVVYFEPTSGKGIVCKVDHQRFFKLLRRMLGAWWSLRLNWNAVKAKWRVAHDEMTTAKFWSGYLGLDK